MEVNCEFLTKPRIIANYLNNFYIKKIEDTSIASLMSPTRKNLSISIIKKHIMSKKNCCFEFKPIKMSDMEELLLILLLDWTIWMEGFFN